MDLKNRLIIFDLDETLVHATENILSRPADFTVPPYFIYQRPFLKTLLASLYGAVDLAVWSSSSQAYVNAVVHEIFNDDFPLQFAWSVDRCVQRVDVRTNSYVYIKDLRKVQGQGYTVDRILMIDDSPEKLVRQPKNHYAIPAYTGQEDDYALLDLLQHLKTLEAVST